MSQLDSSAVKIGGPDQASQQLLHHQQSQAFTLPETQKGGLKSSVYLTEIHERANGIESEIMSHDQRDLMNEEIQNELINIKECKPKALLEK